MHEALTPTRAEPREEKAEEWLVLVAGVPRQWPALSPPPPATASGWARLPPPAPAVITCAPGSARPCPGSPTRPTAPSYALPGTWLPARQGMEGDPDLHPQGGFHHGRGLIDQRRTDPPTHPHPLTPAPREWHEALAQLSPGIRLILTISGTRGDIFKPLFNMNWRQSPLRHSEPSLSNFSLVSPNISV